MKNCIKCGELKPLDAFYKHPQMADGRLNKCKTCAKRDVRENRKKNIDYYREYDRERGNRQPDGYCKQYRSENGPVYRAHTAVGNALRDGKMKRPESCDECGTECRPHGHHDDYAKPLDVRWLCAACHRQWHCDNGPGLNNTDPQQSAPAQGD